MSEEKIAILAESEDALTKHEFGIGADRTLQLDYLTAIFPQGRVLKYKASGDTEQAGIRYIVIVPDSMGKFQLPDGFEKILFLVCPQSVSEGLLPSTSQSVKAKKRRFDEIANVSEMELKENIENDWNEKVVGYVYFELLKDMRYNATAISSKFAITFAHRSHKDYEVRHRKGDGSIARGKIFTLTSAKTSRNISVEVIYKDEHRDFMILQPANFATEKFEGFKSDSDHILEAPKRGQKFRRPAYTLGRDELTVNRGAVCSRYITSRGQMYCNIVQWRGDSGAPMFTKYGNFIGMTVAVADCKRPLGEKPENYCSLVYFVPADTIDDVLHSIFKVNWPKLENPEELTEE